MANSVARLLAMARCHVGRWDRDQMPRPDGSLRGRRRLAKVHGHNASGQRDIVPRPAGQDKASWPVLGGSDDQYGQVGGDRSAWPSARILPLTYRRC